MDKSFAGVTSPSQNDESLVDRFDAYFQLLSANTKDLIEQAFALRYQVYCMERQFLEGDGEQPSGYESDEHDQHAVHSLLLHKPHDAAIGTARLILPQAKPNSLPIQQLLKKNGINARDYFPNESVAEVSVSRSRRIFGGAISISDPQARPAGATGTAIYPAWA